MGLRVRKSIKIAPGVRIGISKSGLRTTIGGHGIYYTFGSSRKKRKSSSSRSKYNAANARKKQIAREKEKADKERRKQLELEEARATVEEFVAKIEEIQSMHKSSLDNIDWNTVAETAPPFIKGQPGPNEQFVRNKIENYNPGFLAKHIKGLNKADNGKFDQELSEAIEKDNADFAEWHFWNQSSSFVLNGDIDGMLEFIQEFNLFDDFTEFGSGFDIGFYDPKHVEIEFDVMPDKVVPKEVYSLTSTGKLSTKQMSLSQRFDIIQDYVCSGALRIARDIMAVLPIDEVIIHATDNILNTATGNYEATDILSVKFNRDTLNKLNFDAIDPSDSMTNFECNMKFLKTKGFQKVDRLSFE